MTKGTTLWNTAVSDEDPFSELRVTEADLEAAIRNLQEKMKHCPHDNVQRWGPSYTLNLAGGWVKYDSYVCKDCAYSSEEPIGEYKNKPQNETNPFNQVLD